ncbi:MAG: OmpH family outer membrane protein [Spirochaetes bacterium]|nr:OmpH family outer membrane protein [Spirochaetota bacterium]
MKRKFLAVTVVIALSSAFCAGAFGQAMTRIAVLDLVRVYDAYSTDSAASRALEDERAKVQTQLEKMQAEINDLQKKKGEAIQSGRQDLISQYDKDIAAKLKNLKDYYTAKKLELEEKKKNLLESSEFAKATYGAIQRIAETEGYSIVLTTTSTDSMMNSIVWYSPLIDITDRVISALAVR